MLLSLKKFCCRKEAWAMQKLFIKIKKEKRKERIEKNGQVSEVSKQWVLRCPPEKRKEMNKIAYVFLQLLPSLK